MLFNPKNYKIYRFYYTTTMQKNPILYTLKSFQQVQTNIYVQIKFLI